MRDLIHLASPHSDTIKGYRHALHRIPETSFEEFKTAAFLADTLSGMGLHPETGIAETGLTALLSGKGEGKTLLIRADMDALRVTEETGLPHASTHPGKMHACGHDGHMAMVLGAALVLSKITDRFRGNVKFLFQPAEEGPGGARPMIEAGVLENPKVDLALGAHLWPSLPKGTIGIKEGPLMAAADFFDLAIHGKGGHGAMPHLCVDPIDTAVQVHAAFQRIVSRKMDPMSPTVITIGAMNGGSSANIIPDTVLMKGTTRTFDKKIWNGFPERLEKIVRNVCETTGATYTFDYHTYYPPLHNHPGVTKSVAASAVRLFGKDAVTAPDPTMGGEDFAFYLDEVPGCFLFIGTGEDNSVPLHNSRFDFDEDVLLTGVSLFVQAALDLLA